MFFTLAAVIFDIIFLALLIWGILEFIKERHKLTGVILIGALLSLGIAIWFQTHRIIPVQYVGISRNAFSQELSALQDAGVASKPFFGSMYQFPASSNYERCETYTPAIKGSYGITIDLCFYYNAAGLDWEQEIRRTGSLSANRIMDVWRNNVVGDVAQSVKEYTPEALSDNRSEVERAMFDNVKPWFDERGIELASVSLKNWEFTSADVAKAFDESIISQRKIAEQTALFEAAKISREREQYEAETAQLVAEWQKQALDELGLSGQAAVEYLWIKFFSEQGQLPDIFIKGEASVAPAIPLASDSERLNSE